MLERLQAGFNTAKDRWMSLDKSQKIKIAAIAGIVLIALVITMVLAFRTTWVTTFEGNDPLTVAQISTVLDDAGIRNTPDTTAGTVAVPQQNVEQARNVVHLSPVLLDQRFDFLDVVSHTGMGVTSTMQNAMLTQADQTRIENMLMQMSNVNVAMVNLDVPPSHMLIAPTTPATASVMVSGTNLTPEIGENIALIVSRSIQGLSLDRVTVMDSSTSHILFDNGLRNDNVMTGRSMVEATELASRDLILRNARESMMGMFPVVNAQGNIVLDWSEITQLSIEHMNNVIDGEYGAHRSLISEEHEREILASIDDANALGIEPGVMANDFPGGPLFPDEMREGVMWLAERDVFRRYLTDTLETMRNFGPPGRFVAEDSTLSVFAGRETIHYRGDMITLGTIDDSDAAWIQFRTDTPERVIYDGDLTQHVAHLSAATGIPIENISLMVYDFNQFLDITPAPPLNITTIVLLVLVIVFIGLLAFGLIRRTQPEVVEEIEPELSVEDLLVSSQLEEAQTSERERLEELRSQEDSAVKEQIDTFVTEKPEAVAQLLRNWINEDWE